MMDATFFVNNLTQFLQALHYRFPDNEAVESALTKLRAVPSPFHSMVMDQWVKLTEPHAENIKHRNGAAVASAFDSSEFEALSSLNVGSILDNPEVDQQTVDTVWQYIDSLCHVAALVNGTALPPPPSNEELDRMAAAATGTGESKSQDKPQDKPQAAQQPAAAEKGPDVEKIVESITSAMPKVIAGLNKVLQTSEDGGENPVGDLLKQLMSPGQLRPGIANNLMANMMETEESAMESVSAETGLTSEEILRRLEKLEKYERLRKRKAEKKH